MNKISANIYPHIFPCINVADTDTLVDVAGPGKRFVIWLQGCRKRCISCANKDFQPLKNQKIISVEKLIEHIYDQDNLDGITLSGGEPILQAKPLLPLVKEISKSNLTIVCYTGFTYKELRNRTLILKDFLSCIDLLIDGEYDQSLTSGGVYRPSSNQNLVFLTNRITSLECQDKIETLISFSNSSVTKTGTIPNKIFNDIITELHQYGIDLKS